MLQNTVRFAAKRSANSYKTQCKLLQNARLNAAKRQAKTYF